MRHVYIPHVAVSKLKKEAKRLQRETGRSHHEILDELAQRIRFPNWHHLTLAEKETERLHARFNTGLYALFDIKHGTDLVGDGFEEASIELHGFLMSRVIEWMRAKYPDAPRETDEAMRSFIDDEFICLAYTGKDKLPQLAEMSAWFRTQTFFPPTLAWLRGHQVDMYAALSEATGIPEPGDEADDESAEPDEPMPLIDGAELRRAFAPKANSDLVPNRPNEMEYYRAFSAGKAAWHWCLHCERAYPLGSFRQEGDFQMCPYEGCDGNAVLDLWQWRAVREHNPSYPEVPSLGQVYPLHPPSPNKA